MRRQYVLARLIIKMDYWWWNIICLCPTKYVKESIRRLLWKITFLWLVLQNSVIAFFWLMLYDLLVSTVCALKRKDVFSFHIPNKSKVLPTDKDLFHMTRWSHKWSHRISPMLMAEKSQHLQAPQDSQHWPHHAPQDVSAAAVNWRHPPPMGIPLCQG